MKKLIKRYIIKKILPAFIVFILALFGIMKINLTNTKALSPLGNTNENYKLVSEEFGDDFSNFIKDNSYLKIYKETGKDILIRLGNSDFKLTNKSIFLKGMEETIKIIDDKLNYMKNKIEKAI